MPRHVVVKRFRSGFEHAAPAPAPNRPLLLCVLLVLAPGAGAIENFDIRLSPEKADVATLQRLRGAEPSTRADAVAETMRIARTELAARLPGVVLLDSEETGGAEVVMAARGRRTLTGPSPLPRVRIARDFVETNAALYGLTPHQAATLRTDADYVNPSGNLAWVRLAQEINGLPVFRSEVTVALTPAGEIVRTVGQLAAGIDPSRVPRTPTLAPADAVTVAGAAINVAVPGRGLHAREVADDGTWATLISSAFDPQEVRTELVYFPLGPGSVTLAWSMVLWQPDQAHHVLVDADDGTLLFRKNLTEPMSFTYRVFEQGSPTPFRPGSIDPSLGQQGARVPPSDVTVESQITSAPAAQNPWLPLGATTTAGNNVEAGLDLVAPNGVDAPVPISGPGAFLYSSNPPPGAPPPGDAPGTEASRNAAVVNLFYWVNRFHDLTYDLGFTESARNFQFDNYGRGGIGGDRISAEAQDSSGTSNANFTAPADGSPGRLQMYLWTGPTPDRDGAFDAEIILHELTHGLSNRLHGNSAGLNNNMARGLAQGWSNFYANALLAQSSEPLQGTYPLGGYSVLEGQLGFTANYYYGIRRFPTAVMSFTGGPGNRPHNPLTFADIDSLQMDLGDGAFPRGPFGPAQADSVHNAGEVWNAMLWEARARIVESLGFATGNQRILQLVTDGMKLSPLDPTFLDARDAIIAADCAAFGGSSELDLWEGFARRGLGFGAQVLQVSPARVVESFVGPLDGSLPLQVGTPSWEYDAVCAVSGANPAPGDTLLLQVPISNPYCSIALTNVGVAIAGGNSVAIGTLPGGGATNVVLQYQIPPETPCGSTVQLQLDVTHDLGAQQLALDIPTGNPLAATFTNPTPIQVPAEATTAGPAGLYPSSLLVSGVTEPVAGVRLRLNSLSHTWPGDIDVLLVGPTGQALIVLSDAFGGGDAVDVSLLLRDDAAAAAPTDGTPPTGEHAFRPTNHGAGDPFALPAPAGPYAEPEPAGAASFAGFAGLDPNGTWSLYVVDDASGDVGAIAGGWTLELLLGAPVCNVCTADLFSDGFE